MLLTDKEKLYIKYKEAYYNNSPLVSDDEFDALEDAIRRENPDSTVLTIVGAPALSNDSYLIKHDKLMLSLDKTREIEDIKTWMNDNKVFCTNKMDGTAVSIIFKNGSLTLAKTRGDGIYGKNITKHMHFVQGVHTKLKGNAEIRGECVLSQDNFKALQEECKHRNLPIPTSVRNTVSGLLNPNRKGDFDLCKYLTFVVYDLISENGSFNYESDKFIQLRDLGFICPFNSKTALDFDGVNNYIEKYKVGKDKYDYLTDGVVLTINDVNLHNQLGETNHHPRYKIAFKLMNETGITRVLEVKYSVGRTGKLNFIAEVVPIELSGAIIKNVTLHNAALVLQHGIIAHTDIEIIRSGEVIPKFLKVVSGAGTPILPTHCPCCGSELKWSKTNIDLICESTDCTGKIINQIIHWCKIIGMDGISESTIEALFNAALIYNYKDLYSLHEDDIKNLPGFGERSAELIIDSILKNKHNIDAPTFIAGLGIAGIGLNSAKSIFVEVGTLDNFLNATYNELIKIDGMGDITVRTIIDNQQYIRIEVNSLQDIGIYIKAIIIPTGKLSGMSFCITGTLSRSRNLIEKDIIENGGTCKDSVGKDLSYLVCNDLNSGSSKVKNAIKYNIKIINEQELTTMLT